MLNDVSQNNHLDREKKCEKLIYQYANLTNNAQACNLWFLRYKLWHALSQCKKYKTEISENKINSDENGD